MHYNRYVKYEDKMYMIDRIFMEGSDFVLLLREFKKDGNRRILEWVIGNNNRGNPKGQQIDRLHKHIHLPIVGCINFSDYALVTAELTYLSIENDTWFSTIQTLIIHAKKIIIELPENGKFGIENEITHEQVIVALSEQYGLIENQKGFYLELATIFNNPTFASKSLLVKYVKRQVFWKDFTNLQLLSDSEVITFLNS